MPATVQNRLALPKLPKRENNAVPRSQVERMWLVAGGIVAFLMLLIGYFFFISPQRSNTADVQSRTSTANQQNAVLQAKLDALREQNKNLGKYEAQLQAMQQALPATSGTSDFLRTLQSLGAATLTDVTELTVGQPVIVTPVLLTAPTAAATTTAPTTTAPTEGAAPAVPAGATPGVYALPITASVTGDATALSKFLDQLQAVQPRAVLISSITMSLGESGAAQGSGTYTLQLTMQAFVAPTSPAEGAALSSSATH